MYINNKIKNKMVEEFKGFIEQDFKNIYYEIKSYSNNDIEVHLYDKNYFESSFILNLYFDKITVVKREDKTFFISAEYFEVYVIIE